MCAVLINALSMIDRSQNTKAKLIHVRALTIKRTSKGRMIDPKFVKLRFK